MPDERAALLKAIAAQRKMMLAAKKAGAEARRLKEERLRRERE